MRTHPLNVTNLVVGLVFLGLAGSWALQEAGAVDFDQLRWLLPLTLVVAGVVGLVAFAGRGLRTRRTKPADPADDYEPFDYTSDIEEKLQ